VKKKLTLQLRQLRKLYIDVALKTRINFVQRAFWKIRDMAVLQDGLWFLAVIVLPYFFSLFALSQLSKKFRKVKLST
jgi:hypothetical protein